MWNMSRFAQGKEGTRHLWYTGSHSTNPQLISFSAAQTIPTELKLLWCPQHPTSNVYLFCFCFFSLPQNLLQHFKNLEMLTQQMSVLKADLMCLEKNNQSVRSGSLLINTPDSCPPSGKLLAVSCTLFIGCGRNPVLLTTAATLRGYA